MAESCLFLLPSCWGGTFRWGGAFRWGGTFYWGFRFFRLLFNNWWCHCHHRHVDVGYGLDSGWEDEIRHVDSIMNAQSRDIHSDELGNVAWQTLDGDLTP